MALKGDQGFELEVDPTVLTTIITLAADPTPADLSVGKCKVFKNSLTGRVWLACNDGGTIKKRQLT